MATTIPPHRQAVPSGHPQSHETRNEPVGAEDVPLGAAPRPAGHRHSHRLPHAQGEPQD